MQTPRRFSLRSLTRAALAGTVVALSLVWGPAGPAGSAQAASGVATRAGDDDGRLMLVLDSSGSMAEESSGGGTKIEAAKTALDDVIGGLPSDADVGLRVYGSEVFSADDPGACTDSERVVDLGTGNRAELRAAVRSYTPYGETPIGYALQQAGDDLGDEGPRTIVLVSDGEPTCEPDPCEVAAELAEDGIDLHIDVVGLDVDGAAREALSCIADAGNGTYYDADDADSLSEALDQLATRALRPYSAGGTPVDGTPTADRAPELAPGDWLDRIGAAGSRSATSYYRLTPQLEGATVHVSATVVSAEGGPDALDLAVLPADGDDPCVQDSAVRVGRTGYAALSPAVAWDATGADDCPAGPVVVRVSRSLGGAESYGGERPVDLELRVVEEPPVVDPAVEDPADDVPAFDLRGSGRATGVRGATSFAAARPLDPGTYAGTLVAGETQIFAVDVDWGQQLQAALTFPAQDGALGDAVGTTNVFAVIDVLSPDRSSAGLAGDATDRRGDPLTALGYVDGPGGSTFENATATVAYGNRGASFGDQASAASLAGAYTVVVTTNPVDGASYEIPFTLDLGVEGRPDAGPDYVEAVDPSPTPDGADDPTTATSAPPTAEPDGTTTAATTETAADSGDGGGDSLPVGLLAAGVVALLAAGVVAVRARRSAAGRG